MSYVCVLDHAGLPDYEVRRGDLVSISNMIYLVIDQPRRVFSWFKAVRMCRCTGTEGVYYTLVDSAVYKEIPTTAKLMRSSKNQIGTVQEATVIPADGDAPPHGRFQDEVERGDFEKGVPGYKVGRGHRRW